MKFERVLPGEYRAQRDRGAYVWVFRLGRRWFWSVGTYSDHPGVWDCIGPFTSKKRAVKDAVANFTF